MSGKKIVTVVVAVLVLSATIVIANENLNGDANVGDANAGMPLGNSTLYVGGSGPGNYSKIQDAIDNASDGDTIFVYNGTYYENVDVNKSINLIGEDKETTVIDGGENGDVIKITANIVSINEFKIQNSSKYPQTPGHYGILLDFSNGCCIENNIIQNNSYGIHIPKNSNNNTISNNYITNNQFTGIWIGTFWEYSEGNNSVLNNIIMDAFSGIVLYFSSGNTIENNTVKNLNEGIMLTCSDNATILGNQVEDIINFGIRLYISNNCNVMENCIKNNPTSNGILLLNSSSTVISKNTIRNNYDGVEFLDDSMFNHIKENTIVDNNYGIRIIHNCNNNQIYHNNLINNTRNAYDECTNIWDNGYSGGNYWSDFDKPSEGAYDNFSGLSQDIPGSDGIVDTPYNISGGNNQDRYPLMNPWNITNLPPIADFTYSPTDPDVNQTITFNASSSYDPDGNITSYEWDWENDGIYDDTGMTATHSWSSTGSYLVRLLVADKGGKTHTRTKTILVSPGDEWWRICDEGGVADGVAVDSNGNVIVTGHSPDGEHLYTVMYKKDGTKSGDTGDDSEQSSLWKMFPTHPIAVDHNNNIIVVDTKYREGVANETTEYYVVKYDNDLNFKWDETYSRITGIYNIVTGVAVDSHNNIIVTGMTLDISPPDFGSDYWTLKLDSEGDVIWREWGKMGITYHKDDIDMAAGVAVDSHDNVIVTGTSISMTEQTYKYSTIKYDEDGNEIWEKHEDGGMALGVATDSHDNVIVIGTFETGSSIIKYKENGDKIWEKNNIETDISDVAVDGNDNIIITGAFENDYYTIKYDENGAQIWNVIYDSGYGNTATGVAVDNEGNIIVTGTSSDGYLTIKYTSTMDQLNAAFDYSPRSPTTQDTIHFTDNSYGGEPPYKYEWSFGDGGTSDKQNPTHRYAAVGTYTVTLTITDKDGATDTASKTITVRNSPPTADFSWSPSNPEVAEIVTFDASSSYDPDGTITKYEWDFGDGTTDTGPTPTHSWGAPSEYRVTLRVTDNDGATDSREKPITVQSPGADAPIANFTWSPKNPKVGENVTFDASASHDPDGTIEKYEWDWDNDGIYDENYSTPIANHLITNGGYYWITLKVTDNEDNSGTTTKRIHIESSPLTADFSYSPEKPTTDDEIKFTDKSYGGTPPYTYYWDFGDEIYSNEQNPMHKYEDKETYIVTLTVMDANGETHSKLKSIEVTEKEEETILKLVPEIATVPIDTNVSFDIVIDSLPNGLSGYNISVLVDNTTSNKIEFINFPSWATLNNHSMLPSIGVWIKAIDINDEIKDNATNVTLATITVKATTLGWDYPIYLGINRLDEDNGYPIDVKIQSATLNVIYIPPLPGHENPPTDQDGDGLYEDLNGNGHIDFDDVVEFFQHFEWIEDNYLVELIDFNGNGLIDYDDIVELFEEV